MELLKEGDFVIVYDTNYSELMRGIVICDEVEGNQIYVAIVKNIAVSQSYYSRNFITKVF